MADYNLKEIEPTQKTIEQDVNRALKDDKAARALLWLNLKFEDVASVYASDLQLFLGTDRMAATRILEKFLGWKLLTRVKVGNVVEYKPALNDKEMALKKYLSRAKLTVGLKK